MMFSAPCLDSSISPSTPMRTLSIRPLRRSNFRGSCDADFDAWVLASEIDAGSCAINPHETNGNISQWLLWQDPFLSIMDPHFESMDLRGHYEKLAVSLKAAARQGGQAKRLGFPAAIASTLALKAHLRRDLAAAYAGGDRQRLSVGSSKPILRNYASA